MAGGDILKILAGALGPQGASGQLRLNDQQARAQQAQNSSSDRSDIFKVLLSQAGAGDKLGQQKELLRFKNSMRKNTTDLANFAASKQFRTIEELVEAMVKDKKLAQDFENFTNKQSLLDQILSGKIKLDN